MFASTACATGSLPCACAHACRRSFASFGVIKNGMMSSGICSGLTSSRRTSCVPQKSHVPDASPASKTICAPQVGQANCSSVCPAFRARKFFFCNCRQATKPRLTESMPETSPQCGQQYVWRLMSYPAGAPQFRQKIRNGFIVAIGDPFLCLMTEKHGVQRWPAYADIPIGSECASQCILSFIIIQQAVRFSQVIL